MSETDPIKFFPTPAKFRKWLEANHAKATVLWVGFYKKDSGKPSITWPESVDQALCFGWIDGVRKSIDEESYKIRFSPRKPKSNWSGVNIKRARELVELGLLHPAGIKAFEARAEYRSGVYSCEQRSTELPPELDAILKKNRKAWDFFRAQSPSYRRTIFWWIVSGKQDATRAKRLARLIELSASGKRLL
jgi:uncharacterized protein YdeI (YjbR/CyaY-like superfamily)